MFSKKAAVAAIASALLIVAIPAMAQTADILVKRYTDLAGSEQNAKALVTGLRDGSEVRLTTDKTTTTFDPPSKKMGYGNIDNALAIAEASLNKQGITNPTNEQLTAALMGGTFKTDSGTQIKLDGVLRMRADGMGWGQIANQLGFKLGEVKRAQPVYATVDRTGRADKPSRPERLERPEKPARPEKPERPSR